MPITTSGTTSGTTDYRVYSGTSDYRVYQGLSYSNWQPAPPWDCWQLLPEIIFEKAVFEEPQPQEENGQFLFGFMQ